MRRRVGSPNASVIADTVEVKLELPVSAAMTAV